MSGRLDGQVALVTGGGRGIGRAIGEALAAAGARVALAARSGDELAEAVGAVEAAGGVARGWRLDVTDLGAVAGVVEEAEAALGPVTLLVNNAGTAQEPGPLWEADPGDWWRDLEVHVRGAFNCCRAVLPGMVERRARAGGQHRQPDRRPRRAVRDGLRLRQGGLLPADRHPGRRDRRPRHQRALRQPRAGADPDGGGVAARGGRAPLAAPDRGRPARGVHAGPADRRPAGPGRRRGRRPARAGGSCTPRTTSTSCWPTPAGWPPRTCSPCVCGSGRGAEDKAKPGACRRSRGLLERCQAGEA